VFPTSGYANPTLTVVALAIRLADHLTSAERAVVVGDATQPLRAESGASVPTSVA